VASRHREHAAQTVAALKSGKHVFVEKPMAISEQECREIIQAVRESGKQVTVGFNRRFAPFYAEMKNQIAKRTGAAVINIRMNASYMSSDFWGATMEEGGAIIGEAVHMVDLMRFFLESIPTSVSAYSLPTEKASQSGENNIVASFKFEDGSIGNLTYCTSEAILRRANWSKFLRARHRRVERRFQTTRCEKGSTRKKQSKSLGGKRYEAQMQSFVRCLREGLEPEITVLDGAKSVSRLFVMLESARNDGAPQNFDIERVFAGLIANRELPTRVFEISTRFWGGKIR
jgi:predicted dehydrogenase